MHIRKTGTFGRSIQFALQKFKIKKPRKGPLRTAIAIVTSSRIFIVLFTFFADSEEPSYALIFFIEIL